MRVPLAILVLLLSVALRAEEDESPLVRLDVPETAGPLDWVLARVRSDQDRFAGEKMHDRLSRRLYHLASELSAPTLVGPPEEPLYAEGFTATPPAPGPLTRVRDRDGLIVERASVSSGSPAPSLDARDFDAALQRELDWLGHPRELVFKIFDLETSAARASGTRTRVLVEAAARERPDPRQWRAVWELEWLAESRPLLTALRTVFFERASWSRRPFTDVTEVALGQNACYAEQLRVGLGDWRQRLDAASGIDIYGHQGVSVGDYDGDGREDLYLAQPAGLPNRLLRNRGDGTFEDATRAAGVGVLDATGGSLFVDLDGDRDLDLLVVTGVDVLIFENRGGGTFRHRPFSGAEPTARQGATLMGCAASDHDGDGDLDLYLYSYIFWAGAGSKTQISYPYPYHDANNGAPNFLFRNDGDFRFVDVTAASGLNVNNRRFSLAASWCDYDGDGDPDLYVANDFGRNNLYRSRGDGTFEDVAEEAGVVDVANGMSVSWCDYDGDGLFDLYVGNMWSAAGGRLASGIAGEGGPRLESIYRRMARGNSLFRNRGDGTFEDVSVRTGADFGRWSWSSEFGDFDGDGRPDLYVTNGFVSSAQPSGSGSPDL